jgi:putative ABC transport system permease protein
MFRNYFIATVRSLKKSPVFTMINVLGLSVGISAFILITLFVRNELTFDQFHRSHDRIYRSFTYNTNGFAMDFPNEVAELLKQTIPEVESVATLSGGSDVLMEYGGEKVFEKEFYSASAELFQIFDFSLKYGVASDALFNQDAVVLSKYMALKYFGKEDVVGMPFKMANEEKERLVTGVLNDIPENSRFQFNVIIPVQKPTNPWRWSGSGDVYILLKEAVDETDFSNQVMSLAVENGFVKGDFKFPIENFGELYFNTQISHTASDIRGNKDFVYVFSAVGIFLLMLACINYVNSSTAKSLARLKEVGIRKVVGANTGQIRFQFLLETMLLVTISVISAAALAEFFLPKFNDLSGKTMGLRYFSDGFILFFLIMLIPVVTLFAGVYPALFASRFKALKLMKGEGAVGKGLFRKYLVAFQLVVTMVLLFGTQIIKNQIDFFMQSEIGMNPSNVISAYRPRAKSYDIVKETIEKVPGVEVVTSSPFPSIGSSKIPIQWTEDNEEQSFNVHYDRVAMNAIKVLDIQIIEGRDFIEGSEEDRNSSVIISESVAKSIGWESPVGRKIKVANEEYQYVENTIIGVFKDLQFNLKRDPLPVIILPGSSQYLGSVNIKINESDRAETVLRIAKAWEELEPNKPFEYSMMGDQIQANYEKEQKFGNVIQIFTWIAILIAGLGLFSLSAFTILQKYKEIGIRKILGATVSGLFLDFLKSYFVLIAISSLIAVPVAYYLLDAWLAEFANRIQVGVGVFAIGIGISMLIVVFTVGYQSIKAALSNPVDILRNE